MTSHCSYCCDETFPASISEILSYITRSRAALQLLRWIPPWNMSIFIIIDLESGHVRLQPNWNCISRPSSRNDSVFFSHVKVKVSHMSVCFRKLNRCFSSFLFFLSHPTVRSCHFGKSLNLSQSQLLFVSTEGNHNLKWHFSQEWAFLSVSIWRP